MRLIMLPIKRVDAIINVMYYDVLLKEIKIQRNIIGIIILCSFFILVCINVLLSS